MVTRFYNIHNIIKFKIDDKQHLLFKDILGNPFEEYQNYLEDEDINDKDLDFSINIVDDLYHQEGCYILDDKYYIKKRYIFTNDHYKIAKWIIEINQIDDKISLKLKPNRVARLFITGFFVDFLIQYILTQKGYSIIHSSGLSREGNSILFSGRGGSGKTSIAMHIIDSDNSFRFLGDDFMIIKTGVSFPYITPLNLFSYNVSPFLLKKFNRHQKITFKLKNYLHALSFGYAKFFTKLNPMDSFSESISTKSKISNIFLIIPTNKKETRSEFIDLSKEKAIKFLINNLKLDSWYVPKYFIQYGFLYPDDKFSQFWEKYEEQLYVNLPDDIIFKKIELPRSVTWEQLFIEIRKVTING